MFRFIKRWLGISRLEVTISILQDQIALLKSRGSVLGDEVALLKSEALTQVGEREHGEKAAIPIDRLTQNIAALQGEIAWLKSREKENVAPAIPIDRLTTLEEDYSSFCEAVKNALNLRFERRVRVGAELETVLERIKTSSDPRVNSRHEVIG
jgi:uncharacterized small protein (DUF1192 family)